jgi:hypothetical protein
VLTSWCQIAMVEVELRHVLFVFIPIVTGI